MAVHHQPAIPLVSLRVSLLADDPPGFAGAGHLIQHLQYPTLEARARAVGAQVRIDRTADAVVYTVTGPAKELTYLAGILRSALLPPAESPGARLAAERELSEERLAEWETAGRHLRAALRVRLFPGDISAAGTEISAIDLASAPLADLWARMYAPERVAVLAVGDVDLDAVRQAFRDLPPARPARGEGASADTVSLVPLAPAEATRGWFGVGYPAEGLDPAAVSVTARLLADAIAARVPESEAAGEHWWTHHGQAISLVVAVPPAQLARTQSALRGGAGALLAQLNDAMVADAAESIRRDMLFYSRTPDRMAEVLGQFIDRGGDAQSAQRFYAELAEVSVADVRAVLGQLTPAREVRVEIAPQKLGGGR